MQSELRDKFNSQFTVEKYEAYLKEVGLNSIRYKYILKNNFLSFRIILGSMKPIAQMRNNDCNIFSCNI